MEIQSVHFVGSYVSVTQCPTPDKPEYAFIGRSNVGKSSIINMLMERRALARVSNTPGKTQTLNHFLVNQNWYIVDLPGYGYAKISKVQRRKWEQFIRNYLLRRENLQCVFHLIDSRIPPQKKDLEFADWMGEMHIPFVMVFTKIDDRKYNKGSHVDAYNRKMLENWNTLPQQFMTSSRKKLGRDEVLNFIEGVNEQFYETNSPV